MHEQRLELRKQPGRRPLLRCRTHCTVSQTPTPEGPVPVPNPMGMPYTLRENATVAIASEYSDGEWIPRPHPIRAMFKNQAMAFGHIDMF